MTVLKISIHTAGSNPIRLDEKSINNQRFLESELLLNPKFVTELAAFYVRKSVLCSRLLHLLTSRPSSSASSLAPSSPRGLHRKRNQYHRRL